VLYTRLWISLGPVLVLSLSVPGYFGADIYRELCAFAWFMFGLKGGWPVTDQQDRALESQASTQVAK
jgi:hypothetical protein